jgi:hypothetical protein
VDLSTSSLKMYWNVAKQFGGQELWRELLGAMKQVGAGRAGAPARQPAQPALGWAAVARLGLMPGMVARAPCC